MDATLRVALCVLEAMWEMKKVKIKLQPSVQGHSVFTDFLFVLNDDKISAFVEVKKPEIATSLGLSSAATAQAIREAHILAVEQDVNPVPIVLTNSLLWSFGWARRAAAQVEILHRYDILMDTEKARRTVVMILQSIVNGTWPPTEE